MKTYSIVKREGDGTLKAIESCLTDYDINTLKDEIAISMQKRAAGHTSWDGRMFEESKFRKHNYEHLYITFVNRSFFLIEEINFYE